MGIRNIPMVLAASMPTKTGVLTPRRAISEAPSAHTSGARPTMNAMKVIVTARKRSFAPSSAASVMLKPRSRSSLANSMMRMAFLAHRNQHDEADLGVEIKRQVGHLDTRACAQHPGHDRQ